MNEKPKTAPFPYFGGKRKIAPEVWKYLGNCENYIEPFAGSAAVLLLRPNKRKEATETLNDADGLVSNFWRAVQHNPNETAKWADNPLNEVDMHARHKWIMDFLAKRDFVQLQIDDPHYFDAKIAGWWCWGACCWIGSGWCQRPKKGIVSSKTQRIDISSWHRNGKGCNAFSDNAFSGSFEKQTKGECDKRLEWITDWFRRLSDRLRSVKICAGDWKRVCGSETVTTRQGVTGIFFDPPYGTRSGRTPKLYSIDSDTVAADVRNYCLKYGNNPLMRIVLAGYVGEGHEELEKYDWRVLAWKAAGGYGVCSKQGKENAEKERLWISPYCRKIGLGFFG